MNIRIHSVVWFIQLIIWDELINTLSNLVTEERILSVFCVDSFLFQQVRFTLISQFLQELSNSTLHQRQSEEKALIHRCDSVFFLCATIPSQSDCKGLQCPSLMALYQTVDFASS